MVEKDCCYFLPIKVLGKIECC